MRKYIYTHPIERYCFPFAYVILYDRCPSVDGDNKSPQRNASVNKLITLLPPRKPRFFKLNISTTATTSAEKKNSNPFSRNDLDRQRDGWIIIVISISYFQHRSLAHTLVLLRIYIYISSLTKLVLKRGGGGILKDDAFGSPISTQQNMMETLSPECCCC